VLPKIRGEVGDRHNKNMAGKSGSQKRSPLPSMLYYTESSTSYLRLYLSIYHGKHPLLDKCGNPHKNMLPKTRWLRSNFVFRVRTLWRQSQLGQNRITFGHSTVNLTPILQEKYLCSDWKVVTLRQWFSECDPGPAAGASPRNCQTCTLSGMYMY
jgi:hypothetical protein